MVGEEALPSLLHVWKKTQAEILAGGTNLRSRPESCANRTAARRDAHLCLATEGCLSEVDAPEGQLGPSTRGAMANDLNNLQRQLEQQLRLSRYGSVLDVGGCRQGLPEAFLPLIHYALLSYSRPVARLLSRSGHELFGKSDLRFIEGAYRVRPVVPARAGLTLSPLIASRGVQFAVAACPPYPSPP